MMATSRILAPIRTVMPYAQYVTTFGYLGYQAYLIYKRYMEQQARLMAYRNGEEGVVELVVKPRRRRGSNRENQDDASPTNQAPPANDIYYPNLNDIHIEPTNSQNGFGARGAEATTSNINSEDDLQVIDSNTVIPLPDSTNLDSYSRYQAIDEQDWSSVSTELESTDSNNGIVNDLYSECYICANSLDDPNKPVATLPFCMHPFHKSCLDGVLKWHQRCPVCDFHIFSPI